MTPEVHAMKKTTRTSLTGKALSEKIGQLKMSAPAGNFVFLFCGLKTLAFSLPCRAGLSRRNQMQAEAGRRREPFLSRRSVTKTEAFVSRVSDQLRSPIKQ
jgi:hypothetical protein